MSDPLSDKFPPRLGQMNRGIGSTVYSPSPASWRHGGSANDRHLKKEDEFHATGRLLNALW
jgi:hypothetical protein